MKRKRVIAVLISAIMIVLCGMMLAGCGMIREDRVKLRDLEFTVLGKEKIPEETTVVYIMNHRSVYDILLMYLFF